jgi:hypothetical protein
MDVGGLLILMLRRGRWRVITVPFWVLIVLVHLCRGRISKGSECCSNVCRR